MVIKEAIGVGRLILEKNGVEKREARLLLAHVLGVKHEELLLRDLQSIEEGKLQSFFELIEKRANGEPYAYLVGYQEFMKLKFRVNQNVLIPRADTECLVQKVLEIMPDRILDVCTGSGCIAVSLAKYLKSAKVMAVDISKEAIEVAIENAVLNQVEVEFRVSDLFENVEGEFEAIVSNPPYIPSRVIEELQPEVQKEPLLALDGGEDGFVFYRKIAQEAKRFLKPRGYLIVEIGFNQAGEVRNIFEKNDYGKIEVVKDLGGNDRVVIGEKI